MRVDAMKRQTIAALAIATGLATACASHNYTDAPSRMGFLYSKYAYLGYDGDVRSVDEVGIMTTDGLIQIQAVDGQPMTHFRGFKATGIYSGGRYQLHLLPGAHVLTMGFHKDLGDGNVSWSTSSISKTVSVDKGQIVHLSLSEGGRTWKAIESDGGSARKVVLADFKELSVPN